MMSRACGRGFRKKHIFVFDTAPGRTPPPFPGFQDKALDMQSRPCQLQRPLPPKPACTARAAQAALHGTTPNLPIGAPAFKKTL
eukprot:320034-Lingulodinium_polyedra.AAC.1